MKYRVDAIDSEGRRRHEVARAESPDDLREMMLAEGLFPKRIEPATEEEKVTFVSRRRVEERLAARRESVDPTSLPSSGGEVTILRRAEKKVSGRIGLVGEVLLFQADRPEDALHLPLARIEKARLTGFPARVLEIVTLDGETLEFAAGLVVAGRVFKEITDRAKQA